MQIKAFPLIGLASSRAGKSGSYRAWTFARNLDSEGGSGRVETARLYALIETIRSLRTRQRWIREAVDLGLLIPYRNGEFYKYISPDKAGIVYNGLLAPDSRFSTILVPVLLKLDDFQSNQWKSELYAGIFEQRNNDQPISRAVIAEIYGISRISQWEYEQSTEKIKVFENYVPLEKVVNKVETIKKLKQLPERRGLKIKLGHVVKQLPNVFVTCGVNMCKKGSTGKYRKTLVNSLSNQPQRVPHRLYFPTSQLHAAERISSKSGEIVYCHACHDRRGFNLWTEVLA